MTRLMAATVCLLAATIFTAPSASAQASGVALRNTKPVARSVLPATRPVGKAQFEVADTVLATNPAERKGLPIVTFKVPPPQLVLIDLASMKGWMQVSNAATLGGASLFAADDVTYLATTARDNEVYIAPFDPKYPGLIPSSAWENASSRKLYSEPKCVAGKFKNDGYAEFVTMCAALGDKGNAVLLTLTHSPSGFGYMKDPEDLGGKGAVSPPVIMSRPWFNQEAPSSEHPYYVGKFDFNVAVSGGSNGKLFINQITTGAMGMVGVGWGTWNTLKPATWSTLAGTYIGAPGCTVASWSPCAVATSDGKVRIFSLPNGKSYPEFEFYPTISPAAPQGLSGEIGMVETKGGRYIILARGKDGKLYRTVYHEGKYADWRSEGGYIMANTQPTCATVNETATCVVQGLDGKLYAKSLSETGAM